MENENTVVNETTERYFDWDKLDVQVSSESKLVSILFTDTDTNTVKSILGLPRTIRCEFDLDEAIRLVRLFNCAIDMLQADTPVTGFNRPPRYTYTNQI